VLAPNCFERAKPASSCDTQPPPQLCDLSRLRGVLGAIDALDAAARTVTQPRVGRTRFPAIAHAWISAIPQRAFLPSAELSATMPPKHVTDFEAQRLSNIARNNAALAALVPPELRELTEEEETPRPPRRPRAPAEPREPPGPPRRSARAEGRPLVNYAADLDELERKASRRPRDGPPRFTRHRLTLEELDAMTDEERAAVRAARGGAGARVRGARRAGACHTLARVSHFPLHWRCNSAAAQLQGVGGIDSGRGRRVQVRRQLAAARRQRRRGGACAARAGAGRVHMPCEALTSKRARFSPPLAQFARQGGRIYDSALGSTCHWCRQARGARRRRRRRTRGGAAPKLSLHTLHGFARRSPPRRKRDALAWRAADASPPPPLPPPLLPQKTVEQKVTCTGKLCGVGRLPKSFCGGCLLNRHGEDVATAVKAGNWLCPRCRGACTALILPSAPPPRRRGPARMRACCARATHAKAKSMHCWRDKRNAQLSRVHAFRMHATFLTLSLLHVSLPLLPPSLPQAAAAPAAAATAATAALAAAATAARAARLSSPRAPCRPRARSCRSPPRRATPTRTITWLAWRAARRRRR
jgi:hypothetical protein